MGAFPEEPCAGHQVHQPLWEHALLLSGTRVAVLFLDLVTNAYMLCLNIPSKTWFAHCSAMEQSMQTHMAISYQIKDITHL